MKTDQEIYDKKKKYELKAKEYIDDPKKTDTLLKKALRKANEKKSALGDAWEKLQLLLELLKAWRKGEYRVIPTSTVLAVIGAIIYFVSPIDIVPDFLAGLGILDDAAVIAFTIKKISIELENFKEWKETRTIDMQGEARS
jgi:uncharacterized membrane protein YkvA (DUF1232 family)